MTHDPTTLGSLVDAGNILSLTLGFVIGYAMGRMKTRTEQATATAHAAIILAEELRRKLEEDDHA